MSMVGATFTGVLELHPRGHGFLRDPARNFKVAASDVYVDSPTLSKYQLRQGVRITGRVDPPARGGDSPRLGALLEIEGREPDQYVGLRLFDDLTAVDPHERSIA